MHVFVNGSRHKDKTMIHRKIHREFYVFVSEIKNKSDAYIHVYGEINIFNLTVYSHVLVFGLMTVDCIIY